MQRAANFTFARQMARMARPSQVMFNIMGVAPQRVFGHTKYTFEDEDYEPNVFQLSKETHQTNAEELINNLPIVEVRDKVVRCTGVQELGLGHPVQYIQLDKRHKYAPVTCKWCGLRYKMAADYH